MVQVQFKNLKKSDILEGLALERITHIVEKFEGLKKGKIKMLLEMENSPFKKGPDYFKVKLFVLGGRYSGLKIEKAHETFHTALADLMEHMLEALNRFGDRIRVKKIKMERLFLKRSRKLQERKEDFD